MAAEHAALVAERDASIAQLKEEGANRAAAHTATTVARMRDRDILEVVLPVLGLQRHEARRPALSERVSSGLVTTERSRDLASTCQ